MGGGQPAYQVRKAECGMEVSCVLVEGVDSMNDIPFWTLTIATACAVVGVVIGLFLGVCAVWAEAQPRRDVEREIGPKEILK
jgi:hypothetical protein